MELPQKLKAELQHDSAISLLSMDLRTPSQQTTWTPAYLCLLQGYTQCPRQDAHQQSSKEFVMDIYQPTANSYKED